MQTPAGHWPHPSFSTQLSHSFHEGLRPSPWEGSRHMVSAPWPAPTSRTQRVREAATSAFRICSGVTHPNSPNAWTSHPPRPPVPTVFSFLRLHNHRLTTHTCVSCLLPIQYTIGGHAFIASLSVSANTAGDHRDVRRVTHILLCFPWSPRPGTPLLGFLAAPRGGSALRL